MNKELTAQEAALAWAQGKKVEAALKLEPSTWKKVELAGVDNPTNSTFYAGVFNLSDSYCFRLAPEPPAKRYRPWTPQEVPVGAWFRVGSQEFHCWIITGWNTAGFFTSNQNLGLITFDEAVSSDRRHSTDNGKTWLPCGVEVES